MKIIVGMVTFGNLPFTKLALESIKDTAKDHDVDFIVVVGKPGDTDTISYLESNHIQHIVHDSNYGFPYSLNDIYDYAWKQNNYDALLIAGNDIVVYPGTVDSMFELATDNPNLLVISGSEYSVKSLIREYPDTKKFFSNDDKLKFTDFSKRPWEVLKPTPHIKKIANMSLLDIQNLCLYRRDIFDIVGYTDVAFYPAYFVDNDYANRLSRSEIKYCTLASAVFFHFWSRTIHQGSGGSTHHYFENNKKYYILKWGGEIGHETKSPNIKIDSREGELEIINRWRSL